MRKHGPAGRRRPARHCFNMVEIVLALGVIAVGVISILALFPIGLTASRDAMADSCGADAADQMLHQLEYMIRQPNGWNNIVILNTVLPNSKPSPIDCADFPIDSLTPVDRPTGASYGGTLFSPTPARLGVYKAIRFVDTDQPSPVPADYLPTYSEGDIVDFSAIVLAWKGGVSIPPSTNPLTNPLPNTVATRLNVELSWPAQLPYAQRQKSYYTKELFNRQ